MLIGRVVNPWLGLSHLDPARAIGAIDQLKKILIVPCRLSLLPDFGCTVACQLILALPRTYRPISNGADGEIDKLNNNQKTDTAQSQVIKPLWVRKRTLHAGLGEAGWAGILIWQIRAKLGLEDRERCTAHLLPSLGSKGYIRLFSDLVKGKNQNFWLNLFLIKKPLFLEKKKD